MIERENVVEHLYDCLAESKPENTWVFVRKNIVGDALALLKEQEPVEAKTMGESKAYGSWWFACGACGHAIDVEDNYCRECGRPVKWE